MSYNLDLKPEEKCIRVSGYLRKGKPVAEHQRNAPILAGHKKTLSRANNLLSKLKGRFSVMLQNKEEGE